MAVVCLQQEQKVQETAKHDLKQKMEGVACFEKEHFRDVFQALRTLKGLSCTICKSQL